MIYFSGAVHPAKGKEKEIKSNAGRERININGVINPDNKEVIVKNYETINANTVIEFYNLIEENNIDASVIFILDNARYNWSEKVQDYLKTSK